MSQFLGTHQTKLDAKNRTSVPSPFRNALRNGDERASAALVLRSSHKHPCIEGWPADVFLAVAKPLDAMDLFGDDQDDLTTALYADAYPVEADKDGRIILPDSLVQHAGLTDMIVFMGLGRSFQIWEPAAAARRAAEARERARSRGLTIPGPDPPVRHVPVMLDEVLHALAPRPGAAYLDGTFGGGGYAAAILAAADCTLWAIDRDPAAIARGAALAARHPGRLHLLQGNFGDMLDLLAASDVTALDGIVLDLGVSSFQIDEPGRGFSFRADGPLDMRMGAAGPTAADLVRTLPEAELADTLYQLGEERLSRRIARAIVAARAEAPITTTGQLAAIIRGVVPPDRSGIDPATRSFQALRIRVNDELGEIERALAAAAQLLAPGGRLVVVSFHSLEDRLVKRFMQEAAGRTPAPSRHSPVSLAARAPARFRLLAARAARPGEAETRANPRARSARLRALARIETEAASA